MSGTINTAKIERRKLWFHSIEELLKELDRIEEADRRGTLNVQGNWTSGQIFAHIASWIEYGWVGYPVAAPPFFIKWVLKWMCKRYLKKGMPAGVKIPGVEGGTKGQDPMSNAEGLARLRQALARLQAGEPTKFDSPAFGPLSYEDRIQLNLRHAELHLSFMKL